MIHGQGRDHPATGLRPAGDEQAECETVGAARDCDREMRGALERAEQLDQARELGVGQTASGRCLRRSRRAPARG
jgi:hypothetical protein